MSDTVISLQAVSNFDRGDFCDTIERFRGSFGRQTPIITGPKVSKVIGKNYGDHLRDRFQSIKNDFVLLSQISESNLMLQNIFLGFKKNVARRLIIFSDYFQGCR